ncbi:MAG: hypothetical protein O3A90_14075 [Proteobacteria bacterium]|nr:hypothetical protein [Pseudomonadota bacterium]
MAKTILKRYQVWDWYNSNVDQIQHAFIYVEDVDTDHEVIRDLCQNWMINIEHIFEEPEYSLTLERTELTRPQTESGLRDLEKILMEWVQSDCGWDEIPEIIDGGFLRPECSDEYLKSQGYEKGRFGFDDGPLFEGWHKPESRWNGWANPFFTAETKGKILATFNCIDDDLGFRSEEEYNDPDINPWIEIKENKQPNEHGLYEMGWGLTWSEEKDWD